jgi:hypothetical protein
MNKGRRIGAIVAATVAAIGMTMTVTTAPATAAKKVKGPQPVSQLLQRVDDNEESWVRVWFKTDKRACNFKLMVWDNNRVEVTNPGFAPFTSLNQNSTLNRGEVDYASFKVDVEDYNRDTWQLMYATMTWKWCGTNRVQSKSTGFLLPIEDAS